MQQDMQQETLFVFVTAKGRVMARLSNGTVVDVTDQCELLPRHACKDQLCAPEAHIIAHAA